MQISLFVLKYSSLEPTFSLYDALIHLHIYCFKPHFPSYMFIWPYMIISFLQIFLPTRLFRPTLVLGTLEYIVKDLPKLSCIQDALLNYVYPVINVANLNQFQVRSEGKT